MRPAADRNPARLARPSPVGGGQPEPARCARPAPVSVAGSDQRPVRHLVALDPATRRCGGADQPRDGGVVAVGRADAGRAGNDPRPPPCVAVAAARAALRDLWTRARTIRPWATTPDRRPCNQAALRLPATTAGTGVYADARTFYAGRCDRSGHRRCLRSGLARTSAAALARATADHRARTAPAPDLAAPVSRRVVTAHTALLPADRQRPCAVRRVRSATETGSRFLVWPCIPTYLVVLPDLPDHPRQGN